MNCEIAREQLPLLLYGELSFDEEESLEQHIAACPSCRREAELLRRIHAAIDEAEEPLPPMLLNQCRRELRSRLEIRRAEPAPRWRVRWFGWLPALPLWMKPVGALGLVAVGFLAARLELPQSFPGQASRDADIVATRVRQLVPQQQGRISLVVEETRRKQVQGDLNDTRIRSLLLAALRDPRDPGLRVESVDLLKSAGSREEVRMALLAVLADDPNPGVRLKALEGLKPYAADREVRRALLRALREDENSGVRTQAIELLVQHKQMDMVGALQDLMQVEDNDYIRQRTQRLLREMNASVETF